MVPRLARGLHEEDAKGGYHDTSDGESSAYRSRARPHRRPDRLRPSGGEGGGQGQHQHGLSGGTGEAAADRPADRPEDPRLQEGERKLQENRGYPESPRNRGEGF